TAGSLCIASPALALAGCSGGREEEKEKGGEGVTANEDLMREHGVLRRVLILYREAAPTIAATPARIDAGALAAAATLFRDFGEHYHEQLLEEQHIFPRVRKAGGDGVQLIDTLLAQHKRGREITDYILDRTRGGRISPADAGSVSASMLVFARMYEAHAAREDTVIFPAFKAALGDRGYAEIGEQFEEIEHRLFGRDGFEEANGRIGAIEQTMGISDLASFTVPAPQQAAGRE
ncbi:MAG: hemerythrin domain-containing protein, partial [Sphingomonadales bacterium]